MLFEVFCFVNQYNFVLFPVASFKVKIKSAKRAMIINLEKGELIILIFKSLFIHVSQNHGIVSF